MVTFIPISQKRGCGFSPLRSCILIKAPLNTVSTAISDYFGLEQNPNITLKKWFQQKDTFTNSQSLSQIVEKYYQLPLCQFEGHVWSIWWISGEEHASAFALAQILETDVITFVESPHAMVSNFNLFRGDQLVEIYEFGCECGTWNDGHWDLAIEYDQHLRVGFDARFDAPEDHHFCSSVNQVTEVEIFSALDNRQEDNKGFLDILLRSHDAYLPDYEEIPFLIQVGSCPEKLGNESYRIDDIVVPYGWQYRSSVPSKVTTIS